MFYVYRLSYLLSAKKRSWGRHTIKWKNALKNFKFAWKSLWKRLKSARKANEGKKGKPPNAFPTQQNYRWLRQEDELELKSIKCLLRNHVSAILSGSGSLSESLKRGSRAYWACAAHFLERISGLNFDTAITILLWSCFWRRPPQNHFGLRSLSRSDKRASGFFCHVRWKLSNTLQHLKASLW